MGAGMGAGMGGGLFPRAAANGENDGSLQESSSRSGDEYDADEGGGYVSGGSRGFGRGESNPPGDETAGDETEEEGAPPDLTPRGDSLPRDAGLGGSNRGGGAGGEGGGGGGANGVQRAAGGGAAPDLSPATTLAAMLLSAGAHAGVLGADSSGRTPVWLASYFGECHHGFTQSTRCRMTTHTVHRCRMITRTVHRCHTVHRSPTHSPLSALH